MKDILNKLEKIGFTTYESRIFLALYQGYRMSATEIAKEAKIPRPSIYEILRNFATKGICNEITTPTKQYYEIIDTSVLEDKIRIDLEVDYKKKMARLDECFAELRPLFKSKVGIKNKVDVELIRGYNRQRTRKFLELINESNNGILIMNRFKGHISEDLDRESKKFHKRGGVVKSIYEVSTDFRLKIGGSWKSVTKEDLIKLCEEFAKQGEQIRFLDEVPQFVAVFDQKIVYISLFDENMTYNEMSDLIIKNKRFAILMTNLFNIYWDKADTIEELKKQFTTNKISRGE